MEPHPLLALAAIARLAGNEPDFVDGLRRAWTLYPSKERGDVPRESAVDERLE